MKKIEPLHFGMYQTDKEPGYANIPDWYIRELETKLNEVIEALNQLTNKEGIE